MRLEDRAPSNRGPRARCERLRELAMSTDAWVVLGWVVAIVGVTALHGAVGELPPDNFKLPHTRELRRDSIAAAQCAEGFRRHRPAGDRPAPARERLRTPAIRAKAQALFAQVAELPHVSLGPPLHTRPTGKGPDIPQRQGCIRQRDVRRRSRTRSPISEAKAFVLDKITSASNGSVEFQVGGQVAQRARARAPTRAACCLVSWPRPRCCSSCSARCWRRCCRC